MAKFLEYNPDQAYLLPPSVRDVLGSDHLCFFVRRVVAKLNLEAFRKEYGEEGGPAYAPEMLASVWLYAYALGVYTKPEISQENNCTVSLFESSRVLGRWKETATPRPRFKQRTWGTRHPAELEIQGISA